MSAQADADPLRVLGLAAGADADMIRRAYARALKRIDPDVDPDGFQALRDARDSALAAVAVDSPAVAAGGDADAEAVSFVRRLRSLRRAGDIAGAVALVDRFLAAQPAASPTVLAAGAMLFDGMALDHTLSPGLFSHLADRFDWRDARGAAARASPERHAVVVERIAAEDWFRALQAAAAADPDDRIAGTLLADPPGQPLPPLEGEHRVNAYRVMKRLRHWEQFLLDRFDPRNLVVLRDAAQGPALTDAPGPAPTPAATGSLPVAPKPTPSRPAPGPVARAGFAAAFGRVWRRNPRSMVVAGAALLAAIGIQAGWIDPPGGPSAALPGPSPGARSALDPAVIARGVLDASALRWVTLGSQDGHPTADLSAIVGNAAALRAVRYGVDDPDPDQALPLPADRGVWPIPQDRLGATVLDLPDDTRFVSVSVIYLDGRTSPVLVFPVAGGRR